MIRIELLSWEAARSRAAPIRFEVFVEEQGVSEADEWDAADRDACHVLAEDSNRDAVGTGRLDATGKIGRIAVLPPHRGRGLGSAIVRHLVNQATELGLARVYLHAQVAARSFYERLGFRADGPVFDEVGIPHQRMTLGIGREDGNEAGSHRHEGHPLVAR